VVENWFWDYAVGHHVVQLLLFLSLWFPDLVSLVGWLKVWLIGGDSTRVDESYKVFNLDCSV
jgi:L-gulonolactone oxidase